MPKILFIQPTQYAPDGSLCKQRQLYLPGLVFPLLAALTPPHWNVEVCLEVIDTVDFDSDADIIGIGTMGYATFRGIDIAREFRKKGKLVVMGGYMASIMVDEALKHVDSVIVGDAEKSYPQMLTDFENEKSIKKIYDMPVISLAGLPIPRYEILTKKRIGNMLPVQAGRGCNHTCSFCSIACVYRGKYFSRPVDEVLRDITEIKRLGFKRFYLIDDNIISNPEYFFEICKGIRSLKMRWATQCSLELAKHKELLKAAVDSGAELMSFGLESISQDSLNTLGKPWVKANNHIASVNTLASAGIMVSSEMIVGVDGDTEESIRSTKDFVIKAKIPIPRFYILTPMPGTKLFANMDQENRLLTKDFKQYTGSDCVHQPSSISAEKVTELYWWMYSEVFSVINVIKRVLFNKVLFRTPGLLLFALVVNIHYRKYIHKKVPPNIL